MRQLGFVVLMLVAVGALFVVVGALVSDSTSGPSPIRYVAYGVLGLAVVLMVFWRVRRRRSRQSLEVALRNRREDQTP